MESFLIGLGIGILLGIIFLILLRMGAMDSMRSMF
jgi:xanthosine utilization system XapX-like protein